MKLKHLTMFVFMICPLDTSDPLHYNGCPPVSVAGVYPTLKKHLKEKNAEIKKNTEIQKLKRQSEKIDIKMNTFKKELETST